MHSLGSVPLRVPARLQILAMYGVRALGCSIRGRSFRDALGDAQLNNEQLLKAIESFDRETKLLSCFHALVDNMNRIQSNPNLVACDLLQNAPSLRRPQTGSRGRSLLWAPSGLPTTVPSAAGHVVEDPCIRPP